MKNVAGSLAKVALASVAGASIKSIDTGGSGPSDAAGGGDGESRAATSARGDDGRLPPWPAAWNATAAPIGPLPASGPRYGRRDAASSMYAIPRGGLLIWSIHGLGLQSIDGQ